MSENKINKITSKIMGTDKSEPAPPDSEVRQNLMDKSFTTPDLEISNRYQQCSQCDKLAENFEFHGIKIIGKVPQCLSCGCFLSAKIPLKSFHCPLGLW